MMRVLAALLLCALAGCGGGGGGGGNPAPAPVSTAFDFTPYLAPPGTSLTAPLGTAWMDDGGYQLLGRFVLPDGSAVAAWLYAPFSAYDPAQEAGCPGAPCRGDGGEHYVIDPDGTLRIDSTQDGGTHGVQYFTGPACGGTGWVVARGDIDATWRSLVATLSAQPSPQQCGTGSMAFTRYAVQTVTLPNLGTRQAVVSEHYDGPSMAMAADMERLFLVSGEGRTVWQAFGPTSRAASKPVPPSVDLSARCPDFGWNTPPVAGWSLEDCRESVNPQPTALTGNDFWRPQ